MDTIAAISTPQGQGAIAVVRMSGPATVAVADKVFRGKQPVASLAARSAHLGEIIDTDGERIDHVLLTRFAAPASYTGEEVVEISGHGGMLVAGKVLSALLAAGARAAEPGEFSKRAFMNGKLDLTQAEAVMDLIGARTSLALRAANRQLEGSLGEKVSAIRRELLETLAHIEAYIDFPEEDIDPQTGEAINQRLRAAADGAEALIATAEQGRILREGLTVVLCGPPNAGKSSLLNRLLGSDRAIVSQTAGTTRDTIEELVNMRGIPVRLIDTAGLRESDDHIEQQGIERAEREIAGADVVLEIADASLPKNDHNIPAMPAEPRYLLALNKSDLGLHSSWEGITGTTISCLDESGIDALIDAVVGPLLDGSLEWGSDLVAVNARHRRCLEKVTAQSRAASAALTAGESPELVAVDVREALAAVGEVVGEADIEELLGVIFSSFCIGK